HAAARAAQADAVAAQAGGRERRRQVVGFVPHHVAPGTSFACRVGWQRAARRRRMDRRRAHVAVTSSLPGPLVAALDELSRVPRLLVALDFDGTLAPEVDSPDNARALPAARDAVLRLHAAPGTRVALVSGRALRSLIHVAQ